MTTREPDEPSPRREPTEIDSAFAEIVAGWDREAPSRSDPLLHPENQTPGPNTTQRTNQASTSDSAAAPSTDPDEDHEDHFVPPEPPPIPKPRTGTVGALLLLALGVAMLLVPGLLGTGERVGTPLGLLLLTAGIGWLMLRLRRGPPADSGWDDGAQL